MNYYLDLCRYANKLIIIIMTLNEECDHVILCNYEMIRKPLKKVAHLIRSGRVVPAMKVMVPAKEILNKTPGNCRGLHLPL